MSAEDLDEVKIIDQKPGNGTIRLNQRKTKMAELNFGEKWFFAMPIVVRCCRGVILRGKSTGH